MNSILNNKRLFALTIFIVLSINFLAIPVMGGTNVETYAQVQSSVSFSSLGLISYTHLISDLSLTGLGGDYRLTFDEGDPESWLDLGFTYEGIYNSWVDWTVAFNGYTTTRLSFNFIDGTGGGSLLEYNALDSVLTIFSNHGSKVILIMQNMNEPYPTNWMFNQAYHDYWINLANHCKGDNRIAAFSLWGEVVPSNYPGHTKAQVVQVFADLVKAIHVVDPDRVVIFPDPDQFYDSSAQWIADVKATGINKESNVVFDIVHPYFFENSWDMGLTPEGKAQWYTDNWIIPSVNAFGSDKCYSGETFAWTGAGYHLDLQQRWLVAVINKFSQYDVDFCLWSNLAIPSQMNAIIPAIQAANYP